MYLNAQDRFVAVVRRINKGHTSKHRPLERFSFKRFTMINYGSEQLSLHRCIIIVVREKITAV
jgi:hypothetical protein